jgi:D-amino-acid dehydrogenase
MVSMIDDHVKCAMSRLGDHLRVAGSSTRLFSSTTPLARPAVPCWPGAWKRCCPVCDTRPEADGAALNF